MAMVPSSLFDERVRRPQDENENECFARAYGNKELDNVTNLLEIKRLQNLVSLLEVCILQAIPQSNNQ